MTEFLTREQIMAAPELTVEVVEVPEWGGAVRVKALSGAERDRYEASLTRLKGKRLEFRLANVRARLAALAIVDEAGKPVFGEADVAALGRKSAKALDRVFAVAMQLAGLREEDIDELTENFPEGQSGDSTSA